MDSSLWNLILANTLMMRSLLITGKQLLFVHVGEHCVSMVE